MIGIKEFTGSVIGFWRSVDAREFATCLYRFLIKVMVNIYHDVWMEWIISYKNLIITHDSILCDFNDAISNIEYYAILHLNFNYYYSRIKYFSLLKFISFIRNCSLQLNNFVLKNLQIWISSIQYIKKFLYFDMMKIMKRIKRPIYKEINK